MANTPAVTVFTNSIPVAGSISSAYNLSKGWGKIVLDIPTMIARCVTATCQVKVLAASTEDGVYSVIYPSSNDSTVSEYKTSDNPRTPLYRTLDTVGDGTGVSNVVQDASLTTLTYFISPPAGTEYHINRMIVAYEDAQGWRADGYGANTPSLVSGIEVLMTDSGDVTKIDLSVFPIINNAGWGRICYDYNLQSFGAGNDFANARWTFTKDSEAIRLNGDSGDKLKVHTREDMSFLASQYFTVRGWSETNPISIARKVEVPTGFQFLKVQVPQSCSAAATFNFICSD